MPNSKVMLDLSLIRAVAWDFDGPLADSIKVHAETRLAAFAAEGFGDVPAELHAHGPSHGASTFEIIGGILKKAGKIPLDVDPAQDERVQRLAVRKRELYHERAQTGLDAAPGSLVLFRALQQRYVGQIAIVTTAVRGEVLPFIARHKLQGTIGDDLLITEEVILDRGARLKPEPDAYLLAMERLGIKDPRELLVIEDSVGGATAARAAGATLLVVNPVQPIEEFEAIKPEYFVTSLEDVQLS
jgi:beta-phosphoglucomutase-like phosphatase (HAD superfamily)